MVEMDKVEKWRREYARMSDAELTGQMHQWVEHSEMHIAAKLLLEERRQKQERLRFHLIFWPAVVAAIASILALFH